MEATTPPTVVKTYEQYQKEVIREQIGMMDKNNYSIYMQMEEDEFWREYATNMNYLYRWAVQEVQLPPSIKARIISWVKQGEYRMLLSPVIEALEKNNPKLIYDSI